jgi:hypothetical protein
MEKGRIKQGNKTHKAEKIVLTIDLINGFPGNLDST